MARNVKIASELNELVEQSEPLIEGEQEDETELDILNEMNASPGDVTWWFRVSRVLGSARNGVTEPRLFEGDATVMKGLADRLRDDHGSGKYRIRVLRNNRLYRRFDMDIEAPARPSAPPERPSEMQAVLSAIEKQNERLIAFMERQTQQQQAPPVPQNPLVTFNPMQQIKDIAGVMAELRAMMPQQNTQLDVVNAILKGVELANGLNSEKGSGETSWIDIIRDVVRNPQALGMLVSASPNPQPNSQPNLQIPLPNQTPPAPQTANPASQVSDPAAQIQMKIRNDILYLCQVAQRQGDVELYADWISDNWPPDWIAGMCNNPDSLQLLYTFEPAAKSFEPWFKNLFDLLKEIHNPMPTPASGTTPNVASATSTGNPGSHPGWSGRDAGNAETDE